MKRQRFLLLLLVFWLGFIPVANADLNMCRDRYGKQVCILKLKRSAKNYWEYRAKISIDGKKQKYYEVYNCRDRTLLRVDRFPVDFEPNSPGELVCQTFQKQANSYRNSGW